jgi:hypothetical protein
MLTANGQKLTAFLKTTNLVSRILFLNYHLSGRAITDTILLPTLDLGRAALKRSYTWHYSTQGLPVSRITAEDCELLPHIFTFSSFEVVIFCGTFSPRLPGGRRLTGGLLCAVRTFLSAVDGTIARVCSKTKVRLTAD